MGTTAVSGRTGVTIESMKLLIPAGPAIKRTINPGGTAVPLTAS